jgi:hypothetical protein
MNNSSIQQAIAQAGAIPVLVRRLGSGSADVQAWAAHAIAGLAKIHHDTIANKGAIPRLVGLLSSSSAGVQHEAAKALASLADDNRSNQQAIAKSVAEDHQGATAQAGAIPRLVELLRSNVAEVRRQAAQALGCLAANNLSNQKAIARGGRHPAAGGAAE